MEKNNPRVGLFFIYLITLVAASKWMFVGEMDNLGGKEIYTSSSRSPCKNALWTSNWCKCQFMEEELARNNHIVVDLAIGEYVSKKNSYL